MHDKKLLLETLEEVLRTVPDMVVSLESLHNLIQIKCAPEPVSALDFVQALDTLSARGMIWVRFFDQDFKPKIFLVHLFNAANLPGWFKLQGR